MTHLPQGWEVKKLNEIFNIERGGSPRPIKVFLTNDENGIPWIKIGDIKNQKYLYETEEKIIEEGLKKSKLVLSGDLLLSNSMSFGKPVIVKVSRGAIHDGWLLLREKLTLDKEYFYYLFSSNFMYSFLSSQASGTTVKNLNIDKLKNIEIPLPPLKEQGRIVGILDLAFEKIDKSVELLKANLANLDELAQSVLDRAFNPLGDSIDSTESTQNPSTHDTQSPYPLPQHWEWKTLGEIGDIITGSTPSKNNPKFYGNDYPLFKPSDLGSGNTIKASDNLSKLGFESARKLPKNTLLVVCIGASIGKIGLSGIIGSCNQQINAIIPSPNVLSKYLFFVCHSKYFQSILKKNASQTTLPIINKTEFSKLEIPLPKDIKEQEQIAMHLDSVFDKIQKLKELYNAQLQDYEELKQSLLTQAFSGKL
ncbi:MAG: restriction endonuclease subunit S [Helicobacter sp.]|uniref:restriction endonuclease subunit S n=1 Tax=Helicobacter sp. TaxID=218 RepID=UPI0037506851|nr:restriction endonuclease subunit S [Helicobacter sp.]